MSQTNYGPKANNKIKLRNGTRPGVIQDVWEFFVDGGEQGARYTKDHTEWKKVKISIAIEENGQEYLLSKTMNAYRTARARYAALIESLTGIEAGTPQGREFDSRDLIGMDVLVTTEYVEPWTNITTISPPLVGAESGGKPVQEPDIFTNTNPIKKQLAEALKHPALTPNERLAVIEKVTKKADIKSITSEAIATEVLAAVRYAIDEAQAEIPL